MITEVKITNIVDMEETYYYDVDIEDYKKWLKENDKTISDDSLHEYIIENDIDCTDYYADSDVVETIVEADELFSLTGNND